MNPKEEVFILFLPRKAPMIALPQSFCYVGQGVLDRLEAMK